MKKTILNQVDVRNILSIETINRISYYHYSKHFTFNGEYHTPWELVYVDSGEVVVSTDHESYTVSQKHFFLHSPNEFHAICSNNTNSKVLILSFECTQGEELLLSLCHNIHKIDSEQLDIFRIILNEYLNNFDGTNFFDLPSKSQQHDIILDMSLFIIRNNLENLFILSLNRLYKAQFNNNHNNNTNPIIADIIQYLNENLNSNITLDELAQKVGYSQSYISKIFRKETNLSITSYLIHLRIEHAKELLADDFLSIQDIAEQTGFSSLQYFSKLFKSKTGYTPSEFRKSIEIHQRYDFYNR